MNKLEFLQVLREALAGLPEEDINSTTSYYSEMIADRMEDGMEEAEAVAAVGDPQQIAAQVIQDTPLPKLVKETIRPKRRLRGWEIALLIIGSPLWVSLLLVIAAVILVVYIANWAVVVAAYASGGAFAGSAVGCFSWAGSFFLEGEVAQALTVCGGALVLVGLAILTFTGSIAASKGLVRLMRLLIRGIKSCFVRKGNGK